MGSKRKILFKSTFQESVDDIIDYIENDSVQNARHFSIGLKKEVKYILQSPTANSPERYLPTKRNWYRRRIYKKRYKIIYKVLKKKLVFLKVVHGARHPDEIAKLRTSNYS